MTICFIDLKRNLLSDSGNTIMQWIETEWKSSTHSSQVETEIQSLLICSNFTYPEREMLLVIDSVT